MIVGAYGDRERTPQESAAPRQPEGSDAGAGKPLRVLIVEDSEDDAELVVLELRRLGYAPLAERVDTRSQLDAALRRPWDLVICDYNLPGFDAPAALGTVRSRHADLPFLVVSGTTSEAQAVPTLLAGAQDFFQKGSLTRLGPAIERELKESEGRKARRHAEVALHRSEQRFQEVLENVSDLIVLLSDDGLVLYASPSCERILGYPAAELEGRPLAELVAPDAAALDALLEEARASGEAGRAREIAVSRKDGNQILLDVGAKDATGKGIGYILNARDITERRRAEKALALAEERLRMAVEAGRLGTWYMDVATGTMEVNGFGREQIGWEPGEPSSFDSFLNRLEPEDRDRVRREVELAVAGEGEFNSVFRASRRDAAGTRWLHAMGRTLPEESGGPGGFFGVALDVTESKRGEMLLLETQQRLRAALLGSNAGTFKLDFASRCLEGDESLALLLSPGNPIGLPDADSFLECVHSEDRDRLAAGLAEAGNSGRELDEEFRLGGTGEAFRWIAVKGRVVSRADGAPAYMTGACVDITDRRQALEQLRQSQKMEAIGRLAGGIAHDFNNLLTAINGYADLGLEHADPGGPIRLPLEEIRKAGERAASLTQQLLAYSRRQVLMPKLVSLDHVVTDVHRLLGRLIGEDIRIRTRLEVPDLLVKVDSGQMQQALVNLSVNARDAMPHGGEIRIETFSAVFEDPKRFFHGDVPPGEYAVLRFSDTGSGMPPEVQARIFEPFFTTKPVGKGTGLGLSMVYGMVRQSEGHVTVESTVGEGTVFTFYLPCAGRTDVGKDGPGGFPAHGEGRRNILLVEDEESVLGFLAQVLESKGYLVHRASDSAAALEAAGRQGRLDLLVTDVVMDGASGPDLWRILRRTHPALPVLFISGYTGDESVLRGSDPESDYLQKPFSAFLLLEKIEALLKKADSTRGS